MERRRVIEMPVAAPQFLIGAKIRPAEKGEKLFRQQLTASLALRLLAGPSSPFYNRLYEEGLLNRFFDADADFSTGVGTVILGGESRDPDAVLKALTEEVERVNREGLDDGLFERTRRAGSARPCTRWRTLTTCACRWRWTSSTGSAIWTIRR